MFMRLTPSLRPAIDGSAGPMKTRQEPIRLTLALFLAGLVGLAGSDCSSNEPPSGLANGCQLNSDCSNPLLCTFGRCHQACANTRDCPEGDLCVRAGGNVNVCQLPDEETCTPSTSCAQPLECATDRICSYPCVADTSCLNGQICADSVCADPVRVGLDGHLKGATDGGVGEDVSSGAGGGGVNDGSPGTDGKGGSSQGACDATLVADGSCDYCPVGACLHGTCVSGDNDYRCECFIGYTASGKSCVVADSCKARNACFPAYPCQGTAPPGQACLGQFAAWPVTEPVATAPTELPAYADTGDGTVTDTVTRLVWQRNVPTPSMGCAVPSPDGGAAATVLPAPCADYCAALDLGGQHDWRVPSKVELESLIDYSRPQPPYIAPVFLPLVANRFWTSSPVVLPGLSALYNTSFWFLNFSAASEITSFNVYQIPGPESVRCVRGTGIDTTTAPLHYTINAGAIDAGTTDGGSTTDTVTDNWTRLTWQRTSSSAPLAHADAVAYCAQLGAFRLPTLKELLTLVDPTNFDPAIDYNAFPATPSGYFCSSTPELPLSGNYLLASFDFGRSQTQSLVGNLGGVGVPCYVRCVR